ncbi:MAG: hypothetical protein AAFR29_09740, partial [Pseudomonadota bacterium]
FNSNKVIGNLLALVGIDVDETLPNPDGVMLIPFSGRNEDFGFDYRISGTQSGDFLRGRNGSQTFNDE